MNKYSVKGNRLAGVHIEHVCQISGSFYSPPKTGVDTDWMIWAGGVLEAAPASTQNAFILRATMVSIR